MYSQVLILLIGTPSYPGVCIAEGQVMNICGTYVSVFTGTLYKKGRYKVVSKL
jgi:hypothetical protein